MPAKRQLPISRAQLAEYFDSATFGRGEVYALENRVLVDTFDIAMPSISAYVRGSKKKPYLVRVRFSKRKSGWVIYTSQCTCPVNYDCKHSAAMLLTAGQIFGFDGEDTGKFVTPEGHFLTAKTVAWLHELNIAARGAKKTKDSPDIDDKSNLVYILNSPDNLEYDLTPTIYYAKANKRGPTLIEISHDDVLYQIEEYGNVDDKLIATMLNTFFNNYSYGTADQDAGIMTKLFISMLNTGRCYFRDVNEPPLKLGHPLAASVSWTLLPSGRQKPAITVDKSNILAFLDPHPWYVDTANWESGPLKLPIAASVIEVLLDAPELEPTETAAVRTALKRFLPDDEAALPIDNFERRTVDRDPVKKLILQSKTVTYADDTLLRRGFAFGHKAPYVAAVFDYGVPGIDLESNNKQISSIEGNVITIINRNLEMERSAIRQLQQSGLEALPNYIRPSDKLLFIPSVAANEKVITATTWFRFLKSQLPKLQESGWTVEIDPSFTVESVEAEDEWSSEVEDNGSWWFSLEIGIEVEGERIPLLPILLDALRRAPFVFTPDDLDSLNVDGKFYAPLEDGRHVALPFERVKDLLSVILDIFDRSAQADEISINPWQAADLANIGITFENQTRLNELAKRVKSFKGISALEAPPEFQATLRDYQKEGLGWLNFIREFESGGILADDMGLGKTVQTLCHILIEKTEGRLDYPALIVCPTSVLPNWVNEAKKFTPTLRVLALYGADRQNNFGEVYEHDIVVTTYALLHRDKHQLAKRNWHVVVLDEAQFIRNPGTLAAQSAFQLQANYRICLTGTPVENHLGDLWSQFHFLIPGYLGDQKNFGSFFRQPIEKHGDRTRQAILSQRVRPFLLRRTKTEVAKELPAKTVMIESVQLDGAQRDLYETVRLTMHEKVKEEILLKGFKRSQIAILEALLRLRQVCCDPRLIGTKFNHKAKDSSKLRRVLDMVTELVDEGRKILIFSQFTSMLDIIAAELQALKIDFVQIRGDTKDRAEPVRKFQAGEVPVFLLSLKAGGTGLNLTAADTVIHYDPWWNPAVENQATDRAHRIGQTKPVFVYKAIAAGTIEERMLQLQEKKKVLAEGIFDEKKAASINITEQELEFLFRPLSDDSTVEESVASYLSNGLTDPQILHLPVDEGDPPQDEKQEVIEVKKSVKRESKALAPKENGAKKEPPDNRTESSDKQTAKNSVDPFIEALRKQGLSVEDIAAGEFMKKRMRK